MRGNWDGLGIPGGAMRSSLLEPWIVEASSKGIPKLTLWSKLSGIWETCISLRIWSGIGVYEDVNLKSMTIRRTIHIYIYPIESLKDSGTFISGFIDVRCSSFHKTKHIFFGSVLSQTETVLKLIWIRSIKS